jgi:hypothetical protein
MITRQLTDLFIQMVLRLMCCQVARNFGCVTEKDEKKNYGPLGKLTKVADVEVYKKTVPSFSYTVTACNLCPDPILRFMSGSDPALIVRIRSGPGFAFTIEVIISRFSILIVFILLPRKVKICKFQNLLTYKRYKNILKSWRKEFC